MISTVILTKNEEKNVLDCIESVLWSDEVIVIDDFSTDRTIEVIKNINSKKVKVFQRQLNSDFSSQRNFALSKAKYDWVFFVDADEIVTKELRDEINSVLIVGQEAIKGYIVKRRDIMWGKRLRYGEIGDIKLLRIAKKNSGDWHGKVHESWSVEGSTSELENELMHFPHQSVGEFLGEINFYTTIRANELYEKKIKSNLFEIIFFPRAKFIVNYVFKLGFLDGIEGLIVAIIMSFHSFLVRGKLWLLWNKK